MFFLAIQNTYHHIEIALLEDNICIDFLQEEKQYASKNFVIMLDMLLQKNRVKLSSLSFCAVNQGPSPFTTLRSVIASVNGLHFALGIPLIGIDGLEALFLEYKTELHTNHLILLNAFNNDVYFYFQNSSQPPLKGYKKIDTLLDYVREQIPSDSISFLGNAATLYNDKITALFDHAAIHFLNPNPATCSIQYIGTLGYLYWQNKEKLSTSIAPLYLKQHSVYDHNSSLSHTRTL